MFKLYTRVSLRNKKAKILSHKISTFPLKSSFISMNRRSLCIEIAFVLKHGSSVLKLLAVQYFPCSLISMNWISFWNSKKACTYVYVDLFPTIVVLEALGKKSKSWWNWLLSFLLHNPTSSTTSWARISFNSAMSCCT